MTEAHAQPISVSELLTDPAGVPRARAMLRRAEWAARSFARYDKNSVDAIVRAAAAAGAAKARDYAEWAVRETGFVDGVSASTTPAGRGISTILASGSRRGVT